MHDAATVREGDGVTHADQPAEQLTELERAELAAATCVQFLDGLGERLTLNEPHGVKRPAIGVSTESIDRHNAGMLEAASDLGFDQKSFAARRLVRSFGTNLLERYLTMQFQVLSHEELSETPAGVQLNRF